MPRHQRSERILGRRIRVVHLSPTALEPLQQLSIRQSSDHSGVMEDVEMP